MPACKNCNANFRQRFKFNGKRYDYRKRVNCFNCSPIKTTENNSDLINFIYGSDKEYLLIQKNCKERSKEFKLKRIHIYLEKTCAGCDLNFKTTKNNIFCSKCSQKIKTLGLRHFAINKKGGKCENCNWKPKNMSEYICLDFHHLKEFEKSFEFSKISTYSFDDIINELSKCKLLCAVCHRLEHKIHYNENLINAALKYVCKKK